jgi:hypothetical protein
MSYTTDNWRTAIINLVKKTSKKEITWQSSEMRHVDAWTEVDRSLECIIKDKVYVVAQTRSKYFLDEEMWVWQGGFHFGIYHSVLDGYELIGAAPDDLSVIASLYDAAASSVAYANDALKDLLD